jgi:hypothetical protein
MKVKKVIEPDIREALTELLAEEELAPHVAQRVRALLRDLAKHDLEMTMLDLAQLARAVVAGQEPVPGAPDIPGPVTIYGDDEALRGVCYGPMEDRRCPWAGPEGALPCNGSWLAAAGWEFKVAEDAREICPISVLMAQTGLERKT